MSARLLSDDYVKGAKAFVRFTWDNIGKDVDWYCCPCLKCHLDVKNTTKVMYEHIMCNGIDPSYTRWVHHGEPFPRNNVRVPSNPTSIGNHIVVPRVEDMVNDIFGRSHPDHLIMDDLGEHDQNNPTAETHGDSEENTKYRKLMEDALKPLYPLCHDQDTRLSATIELLSIKSRHRMSDDYFTEVLSFCKRILLADNVLPEKTSSAKKMIKSLRMKCEVIDACRNDCILYWGEHVKSEVCPTCNEVDGNQ
ncbi:hypothetical protein ACHQM5_029945 [Ranunculus cassubicifolius]